MIKSASKCIVGAVCVTTLIGVAYTSWAAGPSTGDSLTSSLEEIVVTAQKRSERLEDVPIAITAVSGDQLTSAGIKTTQDLAQVVPGLTITNDSGYMLPRIRGIGNNLMGAGYEGGVATYIDGVYIASAPASLIALNDIERVEVLKGPQGTLFGRNATGGLIQIITKSPANDPSGDVQVGYGNYRTWSADTYVTGGFGIVAADFAGHLSRQGDGYGTNQFNGDAVNRMNVDDALRTSLLLSPTDATKIRLIGDYERSDGSVYGAFRLAPGTTTFLPYGAIKSPWNVDSDFQPINRFHGRGVSGRWDQDVGFATFSSISAYRSSDNLVGFDADATPVPAFNLIIDQMDHQFSQELQLASKDSRVQWIVGAYYLNYSSRYDPAIGEFFGPFQSPSPFGPVAEVDNYSNLHTNALAGYGQVTVPIVYNTNLTAGFRYTSEEHEISASKAIDFGAGPQDFLVPLNPQSTRFSKPTWRVSIDHHFDSELMGYVSYNRGFKSGGYNGQLPTDPPFQPEQLDAYELGLKADVLEDRIRLEGAVFDYEYKDIQVGKFTGQQVSYYNGSAARVYGLDVDVLARIAVGLTVGGGFTLLHDRFTDFPNAIMSNQTPAGVVPTIGSAAGNRLPQTPDLESSFNIDYHTPVGGSELGFNVNWSYDSGYYAAPDNILRQPAFNQVNASARIEFKDGITVKFWGRNLTNAIVANALDSDTFHSIASFAPPRTYGVTLTAKFGKGHGTGSPR